MRRLRTDREALRLRLSEPVTVDPESIREAIRQEFGWRAHGLTVERDPEADYERGGEAEPDFSEIELLIERDLTAGQFRHALHQARVRMIERRSFFRGGPPYEPI